MEQKLKSFFKNEIWHWAARGALALGDRMLQEILLLRINEQKELSQGQLEAPGRLAIATENMALAEQIIRDLEKNYRGTLFRHGNCKRGNQSAI